YVHCLVAAGGIEPFHEMPVDLGAIDPPELQKRFLHHVAGPPLVPDDPLRVPDQVPLETQEDSPHPLGLDRVSVVHSGSFPSAGTSRLDAPADRDISRNSDEIGKFVGAAGIIGKWKETLMSTAATEIEIWELVIHPDGPIPRETAKRLLELN